MKRKGVSQNFSPASAVLWAMEVLDPRGACKLRPSLAGEKSGFTARAGISTFTGNVTPWHVLTTKTMACPDWVGGKTLTAEAARKIMAILKWKRKSSGKTIESADTPSAPCSFRVCSSWNIGHRHPGGRRGAVASCPRAFRPIANK